jgi:GGDEF domain-containing protein
MTFGQLPNRNISVSIGAELQPGEKKQEWVKLSDSNLYQAKLSRGT